MVVCRAAQENGAHANGSEYINRNNKIAIFLHSYVRHLLSEHHQIAVEVPTYKGRLHSKLKQIMPAISQIQMSKVSVFVLRFFFYYSTSFRINTKTTLTQECILQSS